MEQAVEKPAVKKGMLSFTMPNFIGLPFSSCAVIILFIYLYIVFM